MTNPTLFPDGRPGWAADELRRSGREYEQLPSFLRQATDGVYACDYCQIAWSNKRPNPTVCSCGREGRRQ